MHNDALEVYPYSIDELKNIITVNYKSTSDAVLKKCHFHYFNEYFDYIKAKTIVVEKNYVDKDFLEDFSAYYVRCFSEYKRKCIRLHFFSTSFSEKEFIHILKKSNHPLLETITKEYLGFVVLKPLPLNIIGRTCLASYPHEGRRYFPIKRSYPVSLFGVKLIINALAFQEQDEVVAACATSALWTVFHGTGYLFHHSIPSPASITKSATDNLPTNTRSMPNKGLTIESMAHAIRSVKLEPILIFSEHFSLLKTTAYAYMRLGIPIVLCFELFNTDTAISIGHHAVAITGYSLDESNKASYPKTGCVLRACSIDKLYVHDDQIGPFARMVFDGIDVVYYHTSEESMSTCWKDPCEKTGNIRALHFHLLIPVYHTIRVSLDAVLSFVVAFNSFLKTLKSFLTPGNTLEFVDELEWDIHLDRIDKLKEEVLNTHFLIDQKRAEILLTAMPKYIWRATAYNDSEPVLDLFFDATDFDTGNFFIMPVVYCVELGDLVKGITSDPSMTDIVNCSPILAWFRNN